MKETPSKDITTPIKAENPQSKKLKHQNGTNRKTPGSSNRKIS